MSITNPLEGMMGYHLRRASGAMLGQLLESYADLDLRLTEATILLFVGANPNVKQSEIGRALDIKSANMAPLIASLDKRDLITRQKLDGRSQGLSLSAEGEKMRAAIMQRVENNEKWLAERLGSMGSEDFVQALSRIWQS